MIIHLLAIGERMPEWVQSGFEEYARRLPREFRLVLHEIPAGRRTKGADLARIKEDEGGRLLGAVPKGARVVALDRGGRRHDTEALAARLREQMGRGEDLALLIGGPEGLSDACRAQAAECWSLSALTLAHPVVRVVLAEQLYRVWAIISNHPYHR
jgi:23S rRNA (pseudouridine1915-N3)-methyltransferase